MMTRTLVIVLLALVAMALAHSNHDVPRPGKTGNNKEAEAVHTHKHEHADGEKHVHEHEKDHHHVDPEPAEHTHTHAHIDGTGETKVHTHTHEEGHHDQNAAAQDSAAHADDSITCVGEECTRKASDDDDDDDDALKQAKKEKKKEKKAGGGIAALIKKLDHDRISGLLTVCECKMYKLPELKAFIEEDAPKYDNLRIHTTGGFPRMAFMKGIRHHGPYSGFDITKYTRQEIVALVDKWGLPKKSDAPSADEKGAQPESIVDAQKETGAAEEKQELKQEKQAAAIEEGQKEVQ